MQLRRHAAVGLAIALGGLLRASGARAQVAQVDLRTTVLLEPAKDSRLTVVNPVVDLAVQPADWLSLSAAYEADVVRRSACVSDERRRAVGFKVCVVPAGDWRGGGA